MKVEVFDDKRSFGHTVAGAVSFFMPIVFVIFIFYEIVEHIYKAGKEKPANFLGDIVEYLFGLGATALAVRMIL
ncbi:hypothetical protein [Archaeoglobus profundus]|uniref:Uncharacterized protein n=1 Tax=Archaeoglobus profundus (strain DSM 5631 / JCM 9629 / NBRC 100127 / Av18) TaxID=572546 RepID=D2REK0_ARCPA|nr:hypothetical protein [Archaeoglobus profundus]ADB58544.1 hypothetical protein Arcpr_1497 [Archaeoglobus profundus DSM 5631]